MPDQKDQDGVRPGALGSLGLILVVLGVFVGTNRPSGDGGDRPSNESTSKKAAPTDKEGADSTAADLTNDYRRPYLEFRGQREGRVARIPAPEDDLGKILAHDRKQGQITAEFLIATIPDPIDSRFGYRFDSVMDALQMAVESQGWKLDRFWLPWWPSGRQFGNRDDLKPVVVPIGSAKQELHQARPGVLLFRGRSEDPHAPVPLLVVLLVGETPTSGVAGGAMAESLRVVQSYDDCAPDSPELRIVGPMFSGSAASLAAAIASWSRDRTGSCPAVPRTVRVRSGSAARVDQGEFQKSAMHQDQSLDVKYDATVVHLDEVMPRLFTFLKERNGGPLGKVALLTESDTAFGHVTDEVIRKWTDDAVVTTMQFPFHISQVAVAYDQSDRKASKNAPTMVRPSSRLTIPFDETGSPRDVVPSLSPAMTTASGEFVMSKILETIAMEDFRYVGIIASDTRDTIFLAGLIRQYCPDVQMFVTEGDLLLGHPRYAPELRGIVVASSYPLFSMAQRWDPPYEGDHRRHLFSHQSDQGIFNAAVTLLGAGGSYYEKLFDYGAPFDELRDLEAFWDGKDGARPWDLGNPKWHLPVKREKLRPGVWFDVVGARGLWPVSNKEVEESDGYLFQAEHNGQKDLDATKFAEQFIQTIPQFSWQWGTVFLGMTLFAWLLFVHHGLIVHTPPGSPLFRGLTGLSWMGASPLGRPASSPREPFLVIGLLAFAAAYIYIALTPCWVAFLESPWAVFLRGAPLELVRWNDRWNIYFGWLTMYVGHATLLALAWTIVRRVALLVGTLGAWLLTLSLAVGCISVMAYRGSASWPWLRMAWLLDLVAAAPKWAAALTGADLGIIHQAASLTILLGLVSGALVAWAVAVRLGDQPKRARKCYVARDASFLFALALPPALALPTLFQIRWAPAPGGFNGLLFFERAINFGSGVSPFIPVLILLVIVLAWVATQTRRIDLFERSFGPGPDSGRRWVAAIGAFLADSGGYLILKLEPAIRRGTRAIVDAVTRPAAAPPARGREGGPRARKKKRSARGQGASVAIAAPPSAPSAPALPKGIASDRAAGGATDRSDVFPRPAYQPHRPGTIRRLKDMRRAYEDAKTRVWHLLPGALWERIWFLAALALGGLILMKLIHRSVPAVDFPGSWTSLAMLTIWLVALTIIVTLARFLFTWLALWRLLHQCMRLPMASAFDRFPPVFSRSFGRYLDRMPEPADLLTIPVQQWAVVAEGLDAPGVREKLAERYREGADPGPAGSDPFDDTASHIAFQADAAGDRAKGRQAALRIHQAYQEEFSSDGPASTTSGLARRSLAESRVWRGLLDATRACVDVLDAYWPAKDAGASFADRKEPGSAGSAADDGGFRDVDESERRWLRSAEDLVALAVVTHISLIAVHLKNLAYYLAIAPILLMLAVGSYPFQPERFLSVCLWSLLIVVVACVVWVHVRMERNEILSRVSRTTPGAIQFDQHFLGSVLAFIVPIVGYALTQFPLVSDSMNQWFEPILRILK